MHREIQIKQFPIVTTHWWPKTRIERFVWENEQYLYRFLLLVHNHVQVIRVHTHPAEMLASAFERARDFWRLHRLSQSARAHTSHTGCVCTQITWTWLCTRGKNDINTVGFLTQPLVSCLRPSMCSYDGELLNLDFSVHVHFPSYRDSDLYLPLYDWQTRTVWPKNHQNWIYWRKKDTYILDALGVSW